MSQSTIQDQLYLVRLKFPDGEKCSDWYTLYVNDDYPISSSKKLVVFCQLQAANKALKTSDYGAKHPIEAPTLLYAEFDFDSALRTLRNEDRTEDDNLVNCLNVLFDCLNHMKIKMPQRFRKVLVALADHLTFDLTFPEILATNKERRQEVLDAAEWAVKQVASNLKIVS